jgi:RIO kinase 1
MSSRYSNDTELDDLQELENLPSIRNMARRKTVIRMKPKKPANLIEKKMALNQQLSTLAAEVEEIFEFTYKAGELEAGWLYASLRVLRDMKWIDDILRMVKGGKEASVYLCQGNATTGTEFIAAKVYRPSIFRSLKNDWLYREGRGDLDESGNRITNKGMLHAMRKRTTYGRQLLHASWLEHEYATLKVLHAAEIDVPMPYAAHDNAILMQYFGDALMGAPTLNDVELEGSEARVLYERMVHNIEGMLKHDRVHGDLSAFNILYWDGDIVMIDFPQAIQPEINRSAFRIFERDVVRVCEYFQRQGVKTQALSLAAKLWEKYNHPTVPQVDPKILGEDEDEERGLWESLKNA